MNMPQKKCPSCGEYLPSNSLTCPKCYVNIPRDVSTENRKEEKNKDGKNMRVAMFLSTLPAIIGLLGLGKIYLEPKGRKGYWFLLGGAVLYLPLIALIFTIFNSGLLSAILLTIAVIVLLLVYISATIAVFIETMMGSIFKIIKF